MIAGFTSFVAKMPRQSLFLIKWATARARSLRCTTCFTVAWTTPIELSFWNRQLWYWD